jgi:hypothetical protein
MKNHAAVKSENGNQLGDSNNISINRKHFYWIIPSILLLVLIVLLSFFLLRLKTNKPTQTSNTEKQKQIPPQGEIKENIIDKEEKGMLEYFISDYLPLYPKFQSEVKPEFIKRIFPLALKKISDNQKRGWLVEVEKESKIVTHYLLTPVLEKELVDSMSCVSQDENPPIELEKVETVGNEGGLGRDLQEKSGYLILSGTKNSCYGGADSGFVSVYNMRTGEKIKLQGDFTVPGTIWKGVSKTGNALGIIRGVYGVNQPTIVVEYGLFKGAVNKVEEVGIIAYFDLQTGRLRQLIKFE